MDSQALNNGPLLLALMAVVAILVGFTGYAQKKQQEKVRKRYHVGLLQQQISDTQDALENIALLDCDPNIPSFIARHLVEKILKLHRTAPEKAPAKPESAEQMYRSVLGAIQEKEKKVPQSKAELAVLESTMNKTHALLLSMKKQRQMAESLYEQLNESLYSGYQSVEIDFSCREARQMEGMGDNQGAYNLYKSCQALIQKSCISPVKRHMFTQEVATKIRELDAVLKSSEEDLVAKQEAEQQADGSPSAHGDANLDPLQSFLNTNSGADDSDAGKPAPPG